MKNKCQAGLYELQIYLITPSTYSLPQSHETIPLNDIFMFKFKNYASAVKIIPIKESWNRYHPVDF
jgi:hypothetical protein